MEKNTEYVQLVVQAQGGNSASMDSLAVMARERLSDYVFRLTLDHDLAQDILQETLLEMVRSIKRLRDAEKFWAWLFRTAMGKVQHHFRDKQRQRLAQLSAMEKQHILKETSEEYGEGLNGLIQKELAEAIFEAMQKLKFRYRNILALRCFEQLSYAEIAEAMNCTSELQARVLFFRAKRALEKQLTHHGFSKKIAVTALGLFGLLTTQTKVASAATAVNAATMEAGALATFIGTVFTQMNIAIASILAAIALKMTLEGALLVGAGIIFAGIFFMALAVSTANAR